MTEVLNKEQVVSKETLKNAQDLLNRLESNVKGQTELRDKLEDNDDLKKILKGVDAGIWKECFKKAKSEEREELAVLFDHLKLEMNQLSFDQTKEELELKNEIQAQLYSLRYQVLSESKNEYDNLENDRYGRESDEALQLSRDRRIDENIAIADLLLPEEVRPDKEAATLFQTLHHQQYALWVLQSLLKNQGEDQISSDDILEKSTILSYYGNDTTALRHDIGRITYLFNTHKAEIQKLEKQQQMFAFVKKIKDWRRMTRVVAYILSSEKYSNKEKFTEQELKADPEIMALYGKKRFLVNEIGRIVALLNATSKENLQKIVDIKGKSGVDIKEAYNAKKFLEVNQEIANTNPFLLLSDLNMTGELDRKERGIANNHRWSEQQLYAAFLSNADTKNVVSSGKNVYDIIMNSSANLNIPGFDTSSNSIKQIVDGKKTADLISGFKLLLSGTQYPVDQIKNNTLQEFSAFLKKYPEVITVYHKELDKRSYNSGVDLSDLLAASQLRNLSNKENLKAVEELNSIRDETVDWFYATLKNFPEDSAERKWFDSLDASSKLSTMRKIIDIVDKIPNPLLSLAGLSVTDANKISKKDLLQTATFKINYLKDDAGIGPRFSMGFNISKLTKTFYHSDGSQIGQPLSEILKGFNPYIDIPLVNISGERDLNEAKVKNANMNEVSSVKKLYWRLGANIHAYFKNPITGEIDKKFSWGLRAALEGAIGLKKDYKEALELQADYLWKVMLEVFKNPNFSDKDSFIKDIRSNLEILKKDSKSEFSRYLRNNPEFDLFIVQDIADALDQIGIFGKEMDIIQKQNAENLLHSLLKGTLEEIKNEKMQHLNWKTKLTRLGIFAQISAFIGGKREALGINKKLLQKNPWVHLAFGLEASISSWKILYAPDKEKLLYMDESLHTGVEIQREDLKTNSSEAMIKSVEELLDRTNIQGLSVEMNKKNQLEIHIPENTLKNAKKNSAWELFNIYLNPDQQNNIAVEKNKITIGNVKDLSLATRNYFDDFAVYLFIGGKGVDQCSTKAKEEKKSEIIEGFTFIPEQAEVKAENKKMTFEYRGFDFDKMRKEVREVIQWVDNQPYNKSLAGKFLTQMNNWEVDEAITTITKMFTQYADRHTWVKADFQKLKQYLAGKDLTTNEKVQTLNTLKALFAFTNVHNISWLEINLKQRKEVFAGLEENFPLDKKEASKMREDLITRAKSSVKNGEIPYPHISNIVGYTAFYHKDNNEGRGYSLNALGNNHVFWGSDAIATIETSSQKEKMKIWLQTKMDKDPEGAAVLLDQIKNNLKGIIAENEVSDEQLKKLLWDDEGLDIQGKNIKLEKEYVFYLLWECANESLGLQLGNILVEGRPAQGAKDQLNLGSDVQSLSKDQILDEKKLNGKWNFFSTNLGQKEKNYNKEWSDPTQHSLEVLKSGSQVNHNSHEAGGINDAASVD